MERWRKLFKRWWKYFFNCFHMSLSIAHAGSPVVRAEQVSPFSKLLWRPSVFPTSPLPSGAHGGIAHAHAWLLWWTYSVLFSLLLSSYGCPHFPPTFPCPSPPLPPFGEHVLWRGSWTPWSQSGSPGCRGTRLELTQSWGGESGDSTRPQGRTLQAAASLQATLSLWEVMSLVFMSLPTCETDGVVCHPLSHSSHDAVLPHLVCFGPDIFHCYVHCLYQKWKSASIQVSTGILTFPPWWFRKAQFFLVKYSG